MNCAVWWWNQTASFNSLDCEFNTTLSSQGQDTTVSHPLSLPLIENTYIWVHFHIHWVLHGNVITSQDLWSYLTDMLTACYWNRPLWTKLIQQLLSHNNLFSFLCCVKKQQLFWLQSSGLIIWRPCDLVKYDWKIDLFKDYRNPFKLQELEYFFLDKCKYGVYALQSYSEYCWRE